MSAATSKPRRKLRVVLLCIAVLLTTTLFTLWYFPRLTFRFVSVTDGLHGWGQRYQTILGISVSDWTTTYPSEQEARVAFDNKIAHAETILARTKNLPSADEQVIGTFINTLNQRDYCIVRLQKNSVYQSYAPSLRYALAFDKFRDRNN